jgi:hypothetical protein
MRLMCDTYEAAGVYWRISRPSAVEQSQAACTTYSRLSMSPSIYLCVGDIRAIACELTCSWRTRF